MVKCNGKYSSKHIVDGEVKNKQTYHTYIERVFTINGKEVISYVDRLSLNLLSFLEYALVKKGIKIKKLIDGNNPWDIEELRIKYKEYEEIERLLKEIMEYRCHPEYDLDWHNIIRQLPFEVLMKTSDAIMNYGKNPEDITIDSNNSMREWEKIVHMVKYECGNPNNTINQLTISKDEPQKRLHLIYRSARGGYNIKTQTYEDSCLDHCCFYDSQRWD